MAAGSIETASQGYVIALLLFSNSMLAKTYDRRAPLPTGGIPTPTIDQLDASIRSMRIARYINKPSCPPGQYQTPPATGELLFRLVYHSFTPGSCR